MANWMNLPLFQAGTYVGLRVAWESHKYLRRVDALSQCAQSTMGARDTTLVSPYAASSEERRKGIVPTAQ